MFSGSDTANTIRNAYPPIVCSRITFGSRRRPLRSRGNCLPVYRSTSRAIRSRDFHAPYSNVRIPKFHRYNRPTIFLFSKSLSRHSVSRDFSRVEIIIPFTNILPLNPAYFFSLSILQNFSKIIVLNNPIVRTVHYELTILYYLIRSARHSLWCFSVHVLHRMLVLPVEFSRGKRDFGRFQTDSLFSTKCDSRLITNVALPLESFVAVDVTSSKIYVNYVAIMDGAITNAVMHKIQSTCTH